MDRRRLLPILFRNGSAPSTLLNALIGYWKLDDGADSTGAYNLSAASAPQAYISGKIGNATRGMSAANKYLFNAGFAALTNTSFTVAAWLKRLSDTTTANYVLRLGNSALARIYMNIDGAEHMAVQTCKQAGVYGFKQHSLTVSKDIWHLCVIWFDISTYKTYISLDNGTPESADWVGAQTDGIGSPLSNERMEIGGAIVDTGAERYVDEVGVWSRVLTDAERTALWNNGSGDTHPFLDPVWNSDYQVIFLGDSLTNGTGSTTLAGSYPLQTLDLLSGRLKVDRAAAGGKRIDQLVSEGYVAQAAEAYSADYTHNVVCVWIGTNDLMQSGYNDADSIEPALWSVCDTLRAAGYDKIVVMTHTPATGYMDAGHQAIYETERQLLATAIRANFATHCDVIVDLAADTIIGEAGDDSNGTYYYDNLHMKDAGYGIVANLTVAALATIGIT